jgi:hypothetical protein
MKTVAALAELAKAKAVNCVLEDKLKPLMELDSHVLQMRSRMERMKGDIDRKDEIILSMNGINDDAAERVKAAEETSKRLLDAIRAEAPNFSSRLLCGDCDKYDVNI